MIKWFRLPRVARLVIGLLLSCALITGGVVYGRRSASNGYACLAVLNNSNQPVELLEVHTGARYTFRRKVFPWADLTLRRISPDGKYTAQLQSAGWRQYTLSVKETATDQITTTQSNIVTAPDPADYGYHDIVWSPDSSRLALVWSHRPPQERFIITLKLDGSDVQRRDNVSFLHGWSVDGQNLAVSLATGSQGFNRPLYLWSLPAAKWTVVSRSGYETIAAVWSPSDARLAFVERPAGNLQGAAWLGIAPAAGGSVTRLALPTVVQQARARLIWSPDGRYLVVIYDSPNAEALSLIDVGKGTTILQTSIDDEQTMQIPQLWLEKSQVLTFVRNNADSTTDWVKYYLDENRYEIVVSNTEAISAVSSPYSRKVIVRHALGEMSKVSFINADGTNLSALVKNANGTAYMEWSPDGKGLAILWDSSEDLESLFHLTWITNDGSAPRTLGESFQGEVYFRWVDNSKALAVMVKNETSSTVRLVNTADASQQTLFTGLATFVTLYASKDEREYMGFLRDDEKGNAWIDVYDSQGQRIYHLQANHDLIERGLVAPDGQSVVFVTRMQSQLQEYEVAISSADGLWSRTIRSRMGMIGPFRWSPDGKMIVFRQQSASRIHTIEIINPDGTTIQSFDASYVRDEIGWAHCDAHE